MIDPSGGPLPPLPLLLWEAPPGLELALGQEGVPFVAIRDRHPLAFRSGRFVLFDGRRTPASRVRELLTPDQVVIDIDDFRRGEAVDPFLALIDAESAPASWEVDGLRLVERVGRYDKAAIRARLIAGLREAVRREDGIWARLAPFPFPYRSAFNLRLDLDEPYPDDLARFAEARRPLDDCSTHFVSTAAYGDRPDVLEALKPVDAQSHGHHHFVYRDPAANRANLRRAHDRLAAAGIHPEGFAAPHGRWNPGLDDALEGLGYAYSSDFQLGHDDLPSFPWRDDAGRFSRVLQVPVHPICEGLFDEAGGQGRQIGAHWIRTVRAKIDAGEPAFVYGHPERRLGRYPEVVSALAESIEGEGLLWRTTLTEYARWWRWRSERAWSVEDRGNGRYEIQFAAWDDRHPLGLEIVRGDLVATIPLAGPRTPFSFSGLAYERRRVRADLPGPTILKGPRGLREAVRSALDWETVTPVEDLPAGSLPALVKRGLRRWKARSGAGR
ncbi:hypothetical protein TA3x_004026 [Tundrisphaera sp. TA3]|uniref:hypothetical protein n=1 Tax=Tundrisphaera sp. TA3 TaxID=3435775 RepID=UPI003EB82410